MLPNVCGNTTPGLDTEKGAELTLGPLLVVASASYGSSPLSGNVKAVLAARWRLPIGERAFVVLPNAAQLFHCPLLVQLRGVGLVG